MNLSDFVCRHYYSEATIAGTDPKRFSNCLVRQVSLPVERQQKQRKKAEKSSQDPTASKTCLIRQFENLNWPVKLSPEFYQRKIHHSSILY